MHVLSSQIIDFIIYLIIDYLIIDFIYYFIFYWRNNYADHIDY